jgi:hypothetical protein
MPYFGRADQAVDSLALENRVVQQALRRTIVLQDSFSDVVVDCWYWGSQQKVTKASLAVFCLMILLLLMYEETRISCVVCLCSICASDCTQSTFEPMDQKREETKVTWSLEDGTNNTCGKQ